MEMAASRLRLVTTSNHSMCGQMDSQYNVDSTARRSFTWSDIQQLLLCLLLFVAVSACMLWLKPGVREFRVINRLIVSAGYMPPFSAPVIDKFRAANGIIMGKTALHELSAGGTSIGPTSNNLSSVLNPYNVRYHCGGKCLPSVLNPYDMLHHSD